MDLGKQDRENTSKVTDLEAREEQDAETEAIEDGMPDSEETRMVTWHGQPGVDYREISVADWKQAGVDIEAVEARTVRWDTANNFSVPLSTLLGFLTKEQVEQYIVGDGRFKIEEME